MADTLRSNFEPGTTRWAVRRAQWLAMGIPEEDFHKPKIAIVNSSSKLSVCYAHLDDVAKAVEKAIRAAGGVPFEIRTVAPSDFVTSAGKQGRYLMPTRDLLVNDVEVQVVNCLACCRFVKLNDSDAIRVKSLLHGICDLLHGFDGFGERFRLCIK